jgi:hypothetical protein
MPTALHPPHAPGIGAIVTVTQNKSPLFRLLLLPPGITRPGSHVSFDPSFGCQRLFDHRHQLLDRDCSARLVVVERIIQVLGLLADDKNYRIGPAPANVLGGVMQVVLGEGVVQNGDID